MKVTLCGSTRFMDQFHAANVALTLAGHVVYSVATSSHGDWQPTEDQKMMLDLVHLRKIEESEAIMVVGYKEDGSLYIGESTRREILHARLLGKTVAFYRPDAEMNGPFEEFQRDLQAAAMTEADRAEAKRKKEEYVKSTLGGLENSIAAMMESGKGGVVVVSDEEDEDEDSDDSADEEAEGERLA